MGTRNLVCAVVDGDYRIAQYGQWDGYPEGQGKTVLSFLRALTDKKNFVKKLKATQWITEDEYSARWKEFGADDSGYVTIDIADKFKEKYPELSRDTGAKIFDIVAKSDAGIKLKNSIDFAGDSLFCEWAYVVDFDKGTFEVYKGFNKNPLKKTERFVKYNNNNNNKEFGYSEHDDIQKYYPVKLAKKYSFSKLPTIDEFVADFKMDDIK